jgi:predicted Zn-dependent peptidase
MRLRAVGAVLGVFWTAGQAYGQERIVVLTEPGTPVVATEVLLAVGPANEEAGRSGLAYLSARSVLAQVQARLDTLGAVASATPHKDGLSISVIAAPDAWERATRDVILALFRDPPDSLAIARERRAIASDLRGRVANPADAATREMDQAFFGATHPWGRPTVGTPQSVERLTFTQVDDFLSEHFSPERALVAVVGPVEATEALAHLRPLIGSGPAAPVQMLPFRSSERPVRREYNSITTWVTASYRFPEGGDTEALRFLTYLATEALSFSPAQRSVYDVWSDVVPRVGGGEIRLQVVIPPEEAAEWAERMEEAMAEVATSSMLDDVFENHLRRFRGLRLLRLTAPEDRAREIARQLLVEGRMVGIAPELDEMTPERVRAAARSLGSPTIVLLGPTLDGG